METGTYTSRASDSMQTLSIMMLERASFARGGLEWRMREEGGSRTLPREREREILKISVD